jgi:WD40 repeat protein
MALPNNTSRFDSVTNSQVPAPNTTWSNLSGLTWSTWNRWPLISANTMTVLSAVTNRGSQGWFNLQITADVTGNIAYGVFVSNSGAFASEETRTEILPNTSNISAFYGQYFAVAANVSGGNDLQLRRLDIVSSNARFDIQFNDLDTGTLDTEDNVYRILPLPRTIGAVTNMQVTAHNPTLQNSIYITTGNTGYVLDYNSTISTVTTAITPAVPTYVNYIMVATKEAPYNYIFKTTNGDTWSNLTVVSNAGGFYGESVDWNHDGTRVAFGLETPSSNNLRVYTRSGDTFTKANDVDTWPAGGVHDVAWTNTDDDWLAVAHDNSPYVSIYAGNNYNKHSNPATLPTGSAFAVAFSPDDSYLAVGHDTSPYITIYSRSGNTFTKLTNPGSLPTATVTDVTWSPDGLYLVTTGLNGSMKIYYNASGTFVAITNPAILPAITGVYTTDWNPSGNAVAIGWTSALTDTSLTTDFGIYTISGNTWTWANSAATTISSTGNLGVYDIEWIGGTGGTQLAVAHHNTTSAGQGMSIYNLDYSTTTLSLASGFASNVGNVYAVGASVATFDNFLPVANVAGFPASGNIRVRNETMSYTTANTTSNQFEGITRAVTTQTFGASTANVHPAGTEVVPVDSIDFTARYFGTEVLGIATAYVGSKDRTSPSVVIRDDNGNYTDGVVDAVLWVLPEQYMETTDLKVR